LLCNQAFLLLSVCECREEIAKNNFKTGSAVTQDLELFTRKVKKLFKQVDESGDGCINKDWRSKVFMSLLAARPWFLSINSSHLAD